MPQAQTGETSEITAGRHEFAAVLERQRGMVGVGNHYAELERGGRNPTLRMIVDWAALLGVSPADLVSVPGARPNATPLSALKAKPPPRGRRPRRKSAL